jgi:hypothetical protein
MVFDNVSMEMTKAISSKSKQEVTHIVACKSFEKDSQKKKDMSESICLNEKTRLLQKSMDFTQAVPIFLSQEGTSNIIASAPCTQKRRHEKNKIDETKTMVFDNVSMEMTKAMSSKNKQEVTDIVACKSSEKDSQKKENINESTRLKEENKLLLKSMDFTQAVPVSLSQERTSNIVDSARSTGKNKHEKYKIDETKFYNDPLMEITKICDKGNVKKNDWTIRSNRPVVFDNASMEMIKAMSSKDKQEIIDIDACKSFEESLQRRKDINESTRLMEKSKLLQRSMDFTQATPISLYQERTSNIIDFTQSSQKNTHRKNRIDGTKLCNDSSMEITKICDESDLGMEPTKVMTSNQDEITNSIAYISEIKEDIQKSKNTNDSINLNESNKLLHKSMECTETNLVLPCHERTLDITAQSSALSYTASRTHFPAKRFTELIPQQNDAEEDAIRTVQNISMEIIPSTMQNKPVNETNSLIISENSEFQNIIINNAAELRKSLMEENFKIPQETNIEMADVHNKLSNVALSLNDLNYSTNTIVKSNTSMKRKSDESEINPKKVCISFVDSRSSQRKNIHSSSLVVDNNSVKSIECNEYLIKDTNHTDISESNLRDTLNEINECSLLRKSLPYLENNCVELQSIKPPSFVCLDSEEENSFLSICKDQLETSTTANDVLTSEHNRSNRLTTNITQSECITESRKNVTQVHENFTVSKEKKVFINIENKQTAHYSNDILRQQEDNCEINCATITLAAAIINDSRNNESNCCATNIEENNRENVLLAVNYEKSVTIPEKDQIAERECVKEKLNDNVKLQDNIENKERCSDKEENLKTEQCVDHLKKRKTIIEDPADPEEYNKKNLNDEVEMQKIKHKEKFDERLEMEQCISENRDESVQDPFQLLSQRLETYAERYIYFYHISLISIIIDKIRK